MSRQNKLLILAVVAVIVVAIGIALLATLNGNAPSAQNPQHQNKTTQSTAPKTMQIGIEALDTPNPLGEIALGSPTAPVLIVEYSSLTCPHCADFHSNTLPRIKEKYIDKGLVRIHFRPFPLDQIALAGAMLLQCVAPQQATAFMDLIYKRQRRLITSQNPRDELIGFARQAGLSQDDYVACLKDQEILDGVRAIQKAANEELQVRSTPTFFVNGTKLESNQPFDAFERVIIPLLPETPTQ